jgi:group I intron endonuclease
MNKIHHIYIITNIETNKSYVGYHGAYDINDNYMGSGKYITSSIKKYGKEKFKKEILEICSEQTWEERETYWIEKKNTKFPNGYNLTNGGDGGKGKIVSLKTKKLLSDIRRERNLAKGSNNGMYGNNHSIESRRKMGESKKKNKHGIGKKNSQFDHTIYKFKNKESGEIFEGYKFDLANKIGSLSCHINAVINGSRKHHKNWILI